MSTVVLLGPQRFRPTLREALDELAVSGPVTLVSAGWQEREGEQAELREHLGREVLDLSLYRRYDELLQRDRELAGALRQRQDRLQRLQELYRLRLGHALAAARALLRRSDLRGDELLRAEQRSAVRALRTLDAGHLRRLRSIHAEFEESWRPAERDSVARVREELGRRVDRSAALLVAGGHVAVLLGRMRLFGVAEMTGARPLVAWSAGAMALAERVVLFHDTPPQGAGDPEVFEPGLARFRGLLPLPHAASRLRLDDPVRVALFARRFAPDACVALDPGAMVVLENGRPVAGSRGRRLHPRGGEVALAAGTGAGSGSEAAS